MKPLRRIGLVLLLGLSLAISKAGTPAPFVVVFVDDESAAKLGGFPLPRSVLASGIGSIAGQKPRGIIVKMFIDQPKERRGDQALAVAIEKAPVVLQARIDDTELAPNPLPEKFYVRGLSSNVDVAISGKSGWLPLELLSSKAHDVGFVDLASPLSAPIVERYQGRHVKSLYLCALELAFDGKAVVQPNALRIADRVMPLERDMQAPIRFPNRDDLNFISFGAVLDGKLDSKTFRDKVVILGYDGSLIHKLPTPIGEMKAHRVFCYGVFDLYERMKKE